MKNQLGAALVPVYGWRSVVRLALMHHGENRVFAVTADSERYVVRLCRPDARLCMLRSEAAWLNALASLVPVPRVVATVTGDPVGTVEFAGQRHAVMVFEFIDGAKPFDEDAGEDAYRQLGMALRRLHSASDTVLDGQPNDWPGRNRPVHNPSIIGAALEKVFGTDTLVGRDVHERFLRVAETAASRASESKMTFDQFVHADLHPGNVLAARSGWVCLDFEECGFGHRAFDLGVVRFHLTAEERMAGRWSAFLQGYGPHRWTEREQCIGTVLRVLYAASKVPDRLDVPDLAGRAPAVLQRYLALSESLLED